MTSGEQAASAVGVSQENGIIHVFLGTLGLFVSLGPPLPHSPILRNVQRALCSQKGCRITSINMKDNLRGLVEPDKKLECPCVCQPQTPNPLELKSTYSPSSC